MPSPLDRLSDLLDRMHAESQGPHQLDQTSEARALLAEVRLEQERLREDRFTRDESTLLAKAERNKATAQVAALAGDRERLLRYVETRALYQLPEDIDMIIDERSVLDRWVREARDILDRAATAPSQESPT